MNYALNTSLFGRVEEELRVCYRLLKSQGAIRKANPIGIIQSGSTLQALHQGLGMIEVEWKDADLFPERVRSVRMPGERAHLFTHRQQAAGNIFACIAKG